MSVPVLTWVLNQEARSGWAGAGACKCAHRCPMPVQHDRGSMHEHGKPLAEKECPQLFAKLVGAIDCSVLRDQCTAWLELLHSCGSLVVTLLCSLVICAQQRQPTQSETRGVEERGARTLRRRERACGQGIIWRGEGDGERRETKHVLGAPCNSGAPLIWRGSGIGES